MKQKDREIELLKIDNDAIKNRNTELDTAINDANNRVKDLGRKNKDLRRTITDLDSVVKSQSEISNNDPGSPSKPPKDDAEVDK